MTFKSSFLNETGFFKTIKRMLIIRINFYIHLIQLYGLKKVKQKQCESLNSIPSFFIITNNIYSYENITIRPIKIIRVNGANRLFSFENHTLQVPIASKIKLNLF